MFFIFGTLLQGCLCWGASWAELPLISARLSAEVGLISRPDLKPQVPLCLRRCLQLHSENYCQASPRYAGDFRFWSSWCKRGLGPQFLTYEPEVGAREAEGSQTFQKDEVPQVLSWVAAVWDVSSSKVNSSSPSPARRIWLLLAFRMPWYIFSCSWLQARCCFPHLPSSSRTMAPGSVRLIRLQTSKCFRYLDELMSFPIPCCVEEHRAAGRV